MIAGFLLAFHSNSRPRRTFSRLERDNRPPAARPRDPSRLTLHSRRARDFVAVGCRVGWGGSLREKVLIDPVRSATGSVWGLRTRDDEDDEDEDDDDVR